MRYLYFFLLLTVKGLCDKINCEKAKNKYAFLEKFSKKAIGGQKL